MKHAAESSQTKTAGSLGQKAVSLLFSFLLAAALSAWVLLLALMTTLFSGSFVSQYIDDDYCQAAYDELMDIWTDYSQSSGIPDEVMLSVLSADTLASDIRDYSQAVWAGESYQVRSRQVGDDLMQAFTDYADNIGTELTDDITEALGTLCDYCVEAYERYASVPLMYTLAGTVRELHTPIGILFAGMTVLVALLALTVIRIHHYWFHGTRYTVYSLLATALVLLPPTLWVLIAQPLTRLNLDPPYFRLLLIHLVNRFLWQVVAFAVLALLAGIGLLIGAEKGRHIAKTGQARRRPGRIMMSSEGNHEPLAPTATSLGIPVEAPAPTPAQDPASAAGNREQESPENR